MHHKTTHAVLDYFNFVRNGESAPLRAEIDPNALKSALPDLFMAEYGQGGGFPFRLAGTRVCAILGQEVRGRDMLSCFVADQRYKMKLAIECVLANRVPLVMDLNGTSDEGEQRPLEMLLLPLRSRETLCDRIFGCLVADDAATLNDERGHLLDVERMTFLRETRTGYRPSTVTSIAVSLPSPKPLMARILNLRVLQGGRKD